jgi:ubiquinone/menaquinone biosynthesis C-methylase UbiE
MFKTNMKMNPSVLYKRSAISTNRFENPEYARTYAVKHSKMSKKFGDKIAALLTKKNFKSGKILDAGSGSGLTLIQLAKKFPDCECYGIDLSDTLLAIANDTLKKENLPGRVSFLKADVHSVMFPDCYFDIVLNINMLHLVHDPVKMLNEIERVLKQEGSFFISDLKKSIFSFFEKEIQYAFTVKEVIEIIARSNLPVSKFSSDLIWWRYQNI